MKETLVLAGAIAGVLVAVPAMVGADQHGGHHPAPARPVDAAPAPVGAPNALQREMQLLLWAMQESVSAVANNQLQRIPPALHRVHSAKEETERALRKGSIRLPRRTDDVDAFLKEDAGFHKDLERLLHAARKNDSAAAARQIGVLMEGCTRCHSGFRD